MEVLVVSGDDRFTAWLLRTLGDAGCSMLAAPSIAASMATLAAWGPGILVTDARPDELTATWLAAVRQARSLLVVVTPRSVDGDLERSMEAGADGFVRCPVGSHELVARLRAIARWQPAADAAGAAGGSVLKIGALQLDRGQGTVAVGGVPVEVVGRERDVLEALMIAAPGVVTREDLWRRVSDGDPTTASLDVVVRRLRTELETVEGWRRVDAVRGVGFRLLDRPQPDRRPAFTGTSGGGHEPFDRSREPVSP